VRRSRFSGSMCAGYSGRFMIPTPHRPRSRFFVMSCCLQKGGVRGQLVVDGNSPFDSGVRALRHNSHTFCYQFCYRFWHTSVRLETKAGESLRKSPALKWKKRHGLPQFCWLFEFGAAESRPPSQSLKPAAEGFSTSGRRPIALRFVLA